MARCLARSTWFPVDTAVGSPEVDEGSKAMTSSIIFERYESLLTVSRSSAEMTRDPSLTERWSRAGELAALAVTAAAAIGWSREALSMRLVKFALVLGVAPAFLEVFSIPLRPAVVVC